VYGGLPPNPKPQSPIPNPQSPKIYLKDNYKILSFLFEFYFLILFIQ